jgi:zinc-ribbon domain
MSNNVNRFCPNCGSPADPGQRFCANCGSAIDVTTVNPHPTALTPGPGSSAPNLASFPTEQEAGPTQISSAASIPPPPPPGMYQSYQTPQSSTAADYQNSSTPQTPLSSYQPVPDFARPQKKAVRRTGVRLFLVVLVLLLILGATGFWYLKFGPGAGNTANGINTNHSTATVGATPTATPTSTTPAATAAVNATTVAFAPVPSFIYADVQVSVSDVKEAPGFPDDANNSYNNPGLVRLDIKEASQPIDGNYYTYSYNAFTLVKADGTTLQESGQLTDASISAGVSRSNWLDFVVNGNVDINKLILRVGAASEAQMDIPLQNGVDLSKYQPKTYQINKQSTYDGVTWTITSVTVSYSALGLQAKTGMEYVIIASRLDNNSAKTAYDTVGGNMRLQSGSTSSTPEQNTNVLTDSIASNQTGVTGNTTFQMPQGSTNFTCNVLKGTDDGADPTSIQFTLS